ncbi:MAG: YicC/YloC family endoribonuclease [Pirellulaceae bacterium]
MLLSMTGHGESLLQRNGASIAVEVRTLNSRYFKLTVRASEGYAAWEPRIEAVVRQCVRRGTVQVSVRVDREVTPDRYQLHTAVLAGYLRQLEGLRDELHLERTIRLEPLLALPGVVDERATESSDLEADWPLMEETLQQALANLDGMRSEEGRVMTVDLQGNCQAILVELEQIFRRAPLVADAYRTRLTERLNKLLHEYDQRVEASDIVREVGTFAERSDISEELVRLGSHIEQFLKFAELPESSGRKLDFLTQEMFRETNTIGSKANDADIASHVVEIKVLIERMREMIQNVE